MSIVKAEQQRIELVDGGNGTALFESTKARYFNFLNLCKSADRTHKLTPVSDPSAFATCFWVFGMHLIRKTDLLADQRFALSLSIRRAVRDTRAANTNTAQLYAKPYRQLLAFSLSALSVLGTLADDPLEDLVSEQLPQSIERDLDRLGCLSGRAQSGNQAMFMAVFLLYARDYLGFSLDDQIEYWVRQHIDRMNRFGFWGNNRSMTALQFQNGYHQYEIFAYLGVDTGKAEIAADSVAELADRQGHFAPYPGGGGCFDYDAVFMMTPGGDIPNRSAAELLSITVGALLSEQQPDGGFCESLYVRPRSLRNTFLSCEHAFAALPNTSSFFERLRYGLALQRRKYDRIETHWSDYSRAWNESDLWDSWFRMLSLARIQCAMNTKAAAEWGFIDFPGIGFHPSLRHES
jgi:hypothetical protein